MGSLQVGSRHRLLCGDSTKAEDVERLMGGELVDACLTDPPYGTASESKVQKRGNKIETFNIEWDKETPQGWIRVAVAHAIPGAAFISFYDRSEMTTLWRRYEAANIRPLQCVYWEKPIAPSPRPNFCSCVEVGVFGRVKDGKVRCWNGGGATSNVFRYPRSAGHERTSHPTQKPLRLWHDLLRIITDRSHLVFDPFLGSGTTIVAAENLGRRCYGMEFDPGYCDVIVERWKTLTGEEAIR